MMACKNHKKFKLFAVLIICLLYPATSLGEMLVGAIFSGNIPYYRSIHVALLDELKKKLPTEENIKYVTQFPAPDSVALSNAAKKLVVGQVDMILSYGYPATAAVLSKESDIPVVYIGVYEPESIINSPHVTGCGYRVSLSSLLDYYKQAMEFDRLCVAYSSSEEGSVRQMNELVKLAEMLKIELLRLDFNSRRDLPKLDDLGKRDGLFITESTMVHVMIKDIMSVLRQKNISAVDIFPDLSEEGVLVTLYPDPEQQGRKAAEIVRKVMAGEKADRIEPVILDTTELVLNLVKARELGTSLPSQLLDKATRVIQ